MAAELKIRQFFGEPSPTLEEWKNEPAEDKYHHEAYGKKDELRMSLFHIYDAFLSADYGANAIGILKAVARHSPSFFDNIEIITFNENLKLPYRFYNVMFKLYTFLNSRTLTKQHAILDFGNSGHSTKLVFTRFNGFVRFLHINTGFGFNGTAAQYDGCYDLFTEIAYSSNIAELCNRLKPFVFKKIVMGAWGGKIEFFQYKTVYDTCMAFEVSFATIPNTVGSKTYYDKLWPKLSPIDDKDYFNTIRNDFFRTFSVDRSLRVQENTFSNQKVLDLWKKNKSEVLNAHYVAYFNAAAKNFVFTVKSEKVYIQPQLGGTCTYMSIIASCLALCTLPQPSAYYTNESFVNFYNLITLAGYTFLASYDFNLDYSNFTSAPVIVQQLIKDGILLPANFNTTVQFTQAPDKLQELPTRNVNIFTNKDPRITQTELETLAMNIRNTTSAFLVSSIGNMFQRESSHLYSNVYNESAMELLYILHRHRDLLTCFEHTSTRRNWQLLISFELTEDENNWLSSIGNIKDNETAKARVGAIFTYFAYQYIVDNFHDDTNTYNTLLLRFINAELLGGNNQLFFNSGDRYMYDMPVTVPYIPTYIKIYFCKLVLHSSGLQDDNGIRLHSEMFMRSAGLFNVKERTRIAALLLQRVASVWKYGKENFGGSYVVFRLVNYIHRHVRVTGTEEFAKYYSKDFLVTNWDMLEVHVGDVKQAESLVSIVLQCANSGILDVVTFADANIAMNSGIKNARLKFAEGKFMYNVRENTWIPCQGRQFGDEVSQLRYQPYILRYLGVTGTFFTCKEGNQPYLLCVLPRLSYENKDMLSEDYLFEFALYADWSNLNIAELKINGKQISSHLFPVTDHVHTVLQTHPYLCMMPRACFKFVILDPGNNDLKVILLQHNNEGEGGPLRTAVFDEKTYKNKHFLLELQIKGNYLLPALTSMQQTYLKLMVQNSRGCMAENMDNPNSKTRADASEMTRRHSCDGDQLPTLSVFADIKKLLQWTSDTVCKTTKAISLENLRSIFQSIHASIETMATVRTRASANIDFTKTNTFEILKHNSASLFQLLQSNERISTLLRIKALFQKWDDIDCYELLEMQVLLEKYKPCTISKIDAVFQIAFGNLVRANQWNKYYEIVEAYRGKNLQVFQFMMGKGKSALITPMLLHYLTYVSPESTLHIVVPSHLKKEVESIIAYYDRLLTIQVNILTDAEIKQEFLRFKNTTAPKIITKNYKAVFDTNSIFLYDEVDDMYDATKSTLNIVSSDSTLQVNLINNLFKVAANVLLGSTQFTPIVIVTPYTAKALGSIVRNEMFKKNVHFGMSHKDETRFCIPYEKRLDSPLEGSRFSSPLYTLAFTARYFFEDGSFVLYKKDVERICNSGDETSNNLVLGLFTEWGIDYNDKQTFETTLSAAFGLSLTKRVSANLMAIYFTKVMSGVSIANETYNCSFVDVMNLPLQYCKWAVGYSGTVQMDLRVIDSSKQRFLPGIIPDPDEAAGVQQALQDVKIIAIRNAEDVWKLVRDNKYTAVIDACALFDKLNNDQVASQLYTASGDKEVVYVRADDTKMSYGREGPYAYRDRFRAAGDVIYFYSQRHIIGIDFKQQPAYLNGLLLIGPQTTRTQAAQAMYRLRRLNKGQKITVGTCFGLDIPENNVLKTLEKTERSEQLYKNTLLRIQYIKYLQRYGQPPGINAYHERPQTNVNLSAAPSANQGTVVKELAKILGVRDNAFNTGSQSVIAYLTANDTQLQQTIKALFNTGDSVETTVVTSTSTSVATGVAQNTEANASNYPKPTVSSLFFYHYLNIWNWTKNSLVENGLLTINNGDDTIIISQNVGTRCNFFPRTYFLVQVTEHTFLLEPVDCLPLYFACGKPLINLSGTIINNYHPFLSKRFTKPVQPNKLLHINCTQNGEQLPLWLLFNVSLRKTTRIRDGVIVTQTDAPVNVSVTPSQFTVMSLLFRWFAWAQHISLLDKSVLDAHTISIKNRASVDDVFGNVYRAQIIPSTHSSHGLFNLYDWEHAYPSLFLYMPRSGEATDDETDYGIIVERNTLQQNNIMRHLVVLTDDLSIPISSRPQTAASPLDILAALDVLQAEVTALLANQKPRRPR